MSIFSKWKKKRKLARKAGLAKFEGRISISRAIGEDRKFTVEEGFSYRCSKGKFTVLPGFVTDGASVPRLFWSYVSPFSGRHLAAVILHDVLYAVHYKGDRGICDEVMDEALRDLGIRDTKAGTMYGIVRAGGWVAWKKSKKKADSQRKFLVVTA